jgi:Flp pilus assembly protein TadB
MKIQQEYTSATTTTQDANLSVANSWIWKPIQPKKNQSNRTIGIDVKFGGLLTVIFVALKLFGVIDWSWWWVLAPLWISVAVLVVLILLVLAVIWIIAVFHHLRNKITKG